MALFSRERSAVDTALKQLGEMLASAQRATDEYVSKIVSGNFDERDGILGACRMAVDFRSDEKRYERAIEFGSQFRDALNEIGGDGNSERSETDSRVRCSICGDRIDGQPTVYLNQTLCLTCLQHNYPKHPRLKRAEDEALAKERDERARGN